ncbi:hypothetical protein [Paenibacillus apiarius]|uniref:hypothetical protein n=1 Tax=Paenibacillus apiarius TaxID=46240 RepID=UPI002DBE6C03|nr:hypothetical protein [Paenibacillus apiarius]MEC0194514.1 hypothetical protein [Paenibacillus apiarius]
MQQVTFLTDNDQWFLTFEGDGSGHALLWLRSDTGDIARTEFGVALSAKQLSAEMLEQAQQALQEAGVKFPPSESFHRSISYDTTTGKPMDFYSRLDSKDGEIRLIWVNEKLDSVAFPVDLDQVAPEHEKLGRQALGLLSNQTAQRLTAAYQSKNGNVDDLDLHYGDDMQVHFNLAAQELYQVMDSRLANFPSDESSQKRRARLLSAVTEDQIRKAAIPLAKKIFDLDLADYKLTLSNEQPGSAEFTNGASIIQVSFNEKGQIYSIRK